MLLSEEHKQMCEELYPLIMKGENEWAKGFISDMVYNTKNFTLKTITRIEELYGEYVNGDIPFTKMPIRYDYEHASARRTHDGWCLFVGEHQVGPVLTRDEAKCIAWLLSEAWDNLLAGIKEELEVIKEVKVMHNNMLGTPKQERPF